MLPSAEEILRIQEVHKKDGRAQTATAQEEQSKGRLLGLAEGLPRVEGGERQGKVRQGCEE